MFSFLACISFFNNWNIIHFSYKATFREDIDKVYQFVLDVIIGNMDALVQMVQHGAINTTVMITIG